MANGILPVEKYGSIVSMSDLWICREKTAKRPFRTETPEMDIYNIEELCYFLYENIYYVDETTINQELLTWISQEIMMPRLAESIAQEQKQGKSTLWCTWFLLKEVGIYTEGELELIKSHCMALENNDALESRKLRADRLLNHGKYRRSIKEYVSLIGLIHEGEYDQQVMGDIFHNLGVANAKLFLFQEATGYFERAYELNKRQESFLAAKEAKKMIEPQEEKEVEISVENWKDVLEELIKDYKKKVM